MEETYGEFYQCCQESTFHDGDIDQIITSLIEFQSNSNDHSQKSYALLLVGAVLDSCELNDTQAEQVSEHAIATLKGLDVFDVVGPDGQFIHYLNHAAVLIEALSRQTNVQPAQLSTLYTALLQAYLRAPESLGHNEAIVIAEILLKESGAEFNTLLKALEPSTPSQNVSMIDFIAMENNKRNLWMSMFVINSTQQQHEQGRFKPVIESMMEQYFPED
ncbi:hypothetical protein [Veronia pacifica]|uniref:Uncharacterized protein n=1 Tax=Veronia pacifica TaxID=1080227 RepID=A0A1C3EAI3_9GAMM|nr:hypothetical protein [Veronia pacifica]ODA30238.1 hypothetical protein A8L45_20770 [Veronia pacifica]